MSETARKIAQLARQDGRYRFEAYAFVYEALRYAHEVLGMGAARRTDSGTKKKSRASQAKTSEEERAESHLTGQQLCEAIRLYALEQYGYMAKCVLNNWGVYSTGDFGEIVFNLIRIGEMRKTKDDRREDFENLYDFDAALRQGFRIEQPK